MSKMANARVRKVLLYESLGDKVQCHTCEKGFLIPKEEEGWEDQGIEKRGSPIMGVYDYANNVMFN